MCLCVCTCVYLCLVEKSVPSQPCFLETLGSMRTVFAHSITSPLLLSTLCPCSGCARGWDYIRLYAAVPVLQAKCRDRTCIQKDK